MVEVRRPNGRARSRHPNSHCDDGFSAVGPLAVIAATVVACTFLFVLFLVADAFAEFPFAADPNRCDVSGQPPGCIALPNEMAGDPGSCNTPKWSYGSTSFCTTDPLVLGSANELFGVSGASVEITWRLETGRTDVLIAELDSGFEWNNGGAVTDLIKKFHINAGELPPPVNCVPPPGHVAPDCSGDGVFNTPDYAADYAAALIPDANGTGYLDPQDLIAAFSNGQDDDLNGYIDDIAGWDFFQNDNDPFDDVQYGHGTGEARDSASEVNNGGDIGACANCMTMPIRVGQSFVADVNAFAQAVVFAVDSGAALVQEALGTFNNSAFGQQAVDYAYAHDVPMIASAADEDAWHHNYPSNYVHPIVVNSIRDFGDDLGFEPEPNSWLYFNGCTNFGGNISFAVPSTSCSSAATGRSAGMAALVISAGRDAADQNILSSPLTANEVRQLLTRTADDIDFETNRVMTVPDTVRYATQAGFDQFTGYGRINAYAAVSRVFAADIPPEAEIDSPMWFQPLDPARDGAFEVRGRVAAERAASYTYRVQIAYGIQPKESDWVDVVPYGAAQASPLAGVLATVDAADVPAPTPEQISRRLAQLPDVTSDYDEFTYTVRLQVTDDQGRLAEDRRNVFVHDDPDLKAQYPLQVGADGASSPAIADIDGDGAGDIVFGTSHGFVHAKRADGSDLLGWPAAVDPLPLHTGSEGYASGEMPTPQYGAVLASIAVGDIDGDGLLDVVAADFEGKVYAWDNLARRKSGFPVTTDHAFSTSDVLDPANTVDIGIVASPALADLDGDGGLDVIVGAMDRHVYVWNGAGVLRAGFPVLVVDQSRMASIDPDTHKVVPLPGAYRGSKIMTSPRRRHRRRRHARHRRRHQRGLRRGPELGADERDVERDRRDGTVVARQQPRVCVALRRQQPCRRPVPHRLARENRQPQSRAAARCRRRHQRLPRAGRRRRQRHARNRRVLARRTRISIEGRRHFFLRQRHERQVPCDGDRRLSAVQLRRHSVAPVSRRRRVRGSARTRSARLRRARGGHRARARRHHSRAAAQRRGPHWGVGRGHGHVSAGVPATRGRSPVLDRPVDRGRRRRAHARSDRGQCGLLPARRTTRPAPSRSAGRSSPAAGTSRMPRSATSMPTVSTKSSCSRAKATSGSGTRRLRRARKSGRRSVHDLRNTGNYEEPAGQSASVLVEGDLGVVRAALKLGDGTSDDRLSLRAAPALGAGNDGMDPSTEGFALSLDNTFFSVPASRLHGTRRPELALSRLDRRRLDAAGIDQGFAAKARRREPQAFDQRPRRGPRRVRRHFGSDDLVRSRSR
jgi:hypothetical protein